MIKLAALSVLSGVLGLACGETTTTPPSQLNLDRQRQFFRRYRPLNAYYYTGDRNVDYGYLDFMPAMRGFDMMVANRDQRIWSMARGVHGSGRRQA